MPEMPEVEALRAFLAENLVGRAVVRADLAAIAGRGRRAVLVGGSGLYVRAALDDLQIPPTDPAVRGRVLSLYFAVLMGGTPLGAPVAGAVADRFGPRWALGVAALAGLLACLIGVGWWFIGRGLRVRVRIGSAPHLVVTHAGRPATAEPSAPQDETLTAPLEVLRRHPLPVGDVSSVPENGPLADGLTGPIPLPKLPESDIEDPGAPGKK